MGAVTASASAAVGDDRLIAGQGTPERLWRAWDGLARLQARDAAELVAPGRRGVVLAPHPDDELLGVGGLLVMLAALERELLIVGVSDGGASHPGSTAFTPQTLAARRRDESAAGLRALGIAAPSLRLGLDDGALALQRDALDAALAAIVAPGDVVFAPWRLDGHPDHEAVGEAAAAICARVGATLVEMPIWMWHWAVPGDARVPWAHAVRVGLSPGVLQLKQAAVTCHRSQLQGDASTGAAPVLADWALPRWMRAFEVFFV